MIAAWTSSSVMVRTLFQSVVGSMFKTSPEVSSFMRFSPPGSDDVSFVVAAISVDHHDCQYVARSARRRRRLSQPGGHTDLIAVYSGAAAGWSLRRNGGGPRGGRIGEIILLS
jgi:hypothetical protein